MGFFHEFVHGCKKVILEEEVRGVTCQRFACPIPDVIAPFAVIHENTRAHMQAREENVE
jgi:hypothetical protein